MNFSSPVLYLSTVLIWGTTFYAIRFQLGEVSPVISVMWRFLVAALVLFAWIAVKRLPCRFSRRQHLWVALQGLLLFSFNYVLVYHATEHLTTGLVAVIFAGVVAMNIFNGAIFLDKAVALPVVFGAICGTAGLALVFLPEIRAAAANSEIVWAIALVFVATYCASLGNIISSRNQSDNIPVLQNNAFGMLYGAIATCVYAMFSGIHLDFSMQPSYIFSMLYLSVFGSILAFGAYLSLIGQVGADRAAYATVMFPLVALGISTIFENYHWPIEAIVGVALVLIGNLLVLDKSLLDKISGIFFIKKGLPRKLN